MKKKLVLLLIAGLTLTGCISPKTYVDPNFGKSSYSDVKTVVKEYDIRVIVEFQRNGVYLDAAYETTKNNVERTLRASGVIIPSSNDSKASLKVTVNNIADIGKAAAKGFGVGLTFGAVGTVVTDYYEVTIVYTDESGAVISKDYKHAIHTTIGNKDAPVEGVLPTTPGDAFATVVEQVLLNFIIDMQDIEKLTFLSQNINKYS